MSKTKVVRIKLRTIKYMRKLLKKERKETDAEYIERLIKKMVSII